MSLYRFSTVINNIKNNIKNNNILKRHLSNKIRTINNEWYIKENNYYKLGLTDNVTDITFLEVEDNDIFEKDEPIVFIETIKAVGEIIAPFDCKLIDINEVIIEDINIINEDQENEDNWIIKIESNTNIKNPDEIINKLKIID